MAASLSGRVAIVMGGAGGIGAATARQLAAAGATCVLVGREPDTVLAGVTDTLSGAGHLFQSCDVTDTPGLIGLKGRIEQGLGRADILINAAGFTRAIPHADLEGLDDALIRDMFEVNWRGQFAAIRTFAPLLKASANGFVANLSSIAAVTGIGSNIAYCAVKAATDSLTQTVARVLAPEVRVIGFAPGVVDTGFVPGRGADWKAAQSALTPLKLLVSPDDVASAILAALLHLKVTTGSTIQVDAGRHL